MTVRRREFRYIYNPGIDLLYFRELESTMGVVGALKRHNYIYYPPECMEFNIKE